jgi:hypothetical protein
MVDIRKGTAKNTLGRQSFHQLLKHNYEDVPIDFVNFECFFPVFF